MTSLPGTMSAVAPVSTFVSVKWYPPPIEAEWPGRASLCTEVIVRGAGLHQKTDITRVSTLSQIQFLLEYVLYPLISTMCSHFRGILHRDTLL